MNNNNGNINNNGGQELINNNLDKNGAAIDNGDTSILKDPVIFGKDKFNNSARVNAWTPSLNEPFDYGGKDKIRGINLGGWLVIEPFITPGLFDQFQPSDHIVDEWTLCEKLGPEEAKKQIEHHYDTFITEEDFKKIAEMGLNHVRIPVGHWAIHVFPGEPFVPKLSFKYLLRGIQWARKYGLRVMVELHTAPGSQNGFNHSGRLGKIGFLNGTQGNDNAEHTLDIIKELVDYFSQPEWAPVTPLFGVLNEPAIYRLDTKRVQQWYAKSYDTLRNHPANASNPTPWLTYHEGFLGLSSWDDFFNPATYKRVILETHMYLIFDQGLVSKPKDEQANFPCTGWLNDLTQSSKRIATMVGEFSIATNDCGKYLNGVGLGTRYEGTLIENGEKVPAVCQSCVCGESENWQSYDQEYKTFLKQFAEKQMSAYETTYGWFFWTYKTENNINPHWDYSLGYEQGWIPKDASHREFSC
ncbi:glycoside hydrolase superfamily [Cunninghamella echinulata]|nr:glycoside hydrolase superfamily [Cunninghamella echinulata]